MTQPSIQHEGDRQRWRVRIRGQVQGVGFRPFVYRLALEHGLSGFVHNDGDGVEAQAQGERRAFDRFCAQLRQNAPPLARIDGIDITELTIDTSARGFRIEPSRHDKVHTGITPDSAVCSACLDELFDPLDRRYRYPFINCTHCGPRYTITSRLPYDRSHTSMSRFTLCAACAEEYDDPRDRRFHAQPNACAECGPRLTLCDADGTPIASNDPIADALARLQAGQLIAIKSLGGFHIACDARNAKSVARLRANKQREGKPFAVMGANRASFDQVAALDDAAAELLASQERPIVLAAKRPACDELMPGVAPDVPCIGVMLPYTPLHYLLFHEAAGRPDGADWLKERQPLLLVMTSANPNGEPLAKDNKEAIERLHGIVDSFLLNDREIVVRCDDSVIRADGAQPIVVRRARGFTPQAIPLAGTGPDVLACGPWYKNTVCVTRDNEAFLSQHIGDLDHRAACNLLSETVAHLVAVLDLQPHVVAHDLHPDFFSTTFAERFAQQHGLPTVAVQHHHAHAAAVMAEHGITRPVLALTLDGIGLGNDGSLWGGELLIVDGSRCERVGHFRPLPLPGGDRAAREPWRMAAAALYALGRDEEIARRFPKQSGADTLTDMLRRNVNCPATSSAGRLFDAAAGLLGLYPVTHFEGQAAMHFEQLALQHGAAPAWPEGFCINRGNGKLILDFLPLLERLTGESDVARGAAVFHSTLVHALASWVLDAAQARQLPDVVLAGGCFLNRLLADGLRTALCEHGLRVYQAQRVPPNDGGISLGQAWVARQAGEAKQ